MTTTLAGGGSNRSATTALPAGSAGLASAGAVAVGVGAASDVGTEVGARTTGAGFQPGRNAIPNKIPTSRVAA